MSRRGRGLGVSMSVSQVAQEAKFICDQWRARIGHLPLAHQQTIYRLSAQHDAEHVRRALNVVVERKFRRTGDRWRLFLAWFGEAP